MMRLPDRSVIAELCALTPIERTILLRRLPLEYRRELKDRWQAWAHPGQLPPDDDWAVWLIRAGRGFGKTLAGAQWVTGVAATMPDARIALVGATTDDVSRVMVEGESGLLAVATGLRPRWKRTQGEVVFDGGAIAYVYPVVEAEDMPDIAANALVIAFGNFRMGYLIAERSETAILRDPYSNKPFVGFYATKRVGGCVTNSEAIKVMKIAAT